jgi:hypothetical protein
MRDIVALLAVRAKSNSICSTYRIQSPRFPYLDCSQLSVCKLTDGARFNLLRHQEHDDSQGLLVLGAVFPPNLLQIGHAGGLQYFSLIQLGSKILPTKSFLFLLVIWQGIFWKFREIYPVMGQESLTAFPVSMIRSAILRNVVVYA